MAGLLTTTFSLLSKTIQKTTTCFLAPIQVEIVRNRNAKHWNPKFKKERKAKVIKIDLPNMKDSREFTPDEMRSFRKKLGTLPFRPWIEKGITFGCTTDIFEAYVPPEGDGKFSVTTKSGIQQNVLAVGKKTTSMLSIRKMKGYLDDFNAEDFVGEARDIYINAHKTLAEKDFEKLRDFVTEKVYAEMSHNIKNKQIRWNFIESLEPARIVRARTQGDGGQLFGQLTVRFHTKQSLAIYDRFGRLMHGSEFVGKDVLEYVVFERYLTNEYGNWRIHGKIIPTWQEPKEPSITTVVKPQEPVAAEQVPSSSEVSPVAPSEPAPLQ